MFTPACSQVRISRVDLAVAIEAYDGDTVVIEQLHYPRVVGTDLAVEHGGIDEWTAPEADVLPEVPEIEARASGQHLLRHFCSTRSQ